MKILIVTQAVDENSPTLGFFVEWIREFARQCEHVDVIALSVGKYALPSNVRIASMGKESGIGKVRRFLMYWKHLAGMLPACDGVFVHMCSEYVIAGHLWFFAFHKPVLFWYAHKSTSMRLRIAAACADAIFTASKESFRMTSPKLEVVGHGIPETYARRVSENGKLRLLSVGRISPVKGHDVVIRALAELVRQGEAGNTVLDIVGAPALDADSAYEASLHELAEQLGLKARVRFLGPMPHARMPDIFATHDLFLHASRTGSLDKVVLEAWAAGVPVISCSEAFPDNYPESHYPDGDAVTLAARVLHWRTRLQNESSLGDQLAARVQTQHGLKRLIRVVIERLSKLG